jgi:CheY-like chemotaxis protein
LNHMVRLVDDLLDLSRVSRGKIALKQGQLDLNEVIGEAVEISRPLISQRSHRLYIKLEEGLLPIEGDRERIIQVIGNLLSNAARYTEPGGTIHVLTETRQGEALLRVRDTGAGIPDEMREEIFEMFTQAPAQGRSGSHGLGIGLAISRQLIHLHGGAIEVYSEGAGRGSEFTMRLPLGTFALNLAPAPEAVDEPRRGRRVLVVDDNVDAADSLGMLLSLQGHATEVVHDGMAALDTLGAFEPEIVLLDIGMPVMDGYEVARRIRRQPGGDRILLVAVTGWGQEGDKGRAREAGFDEHVTKPVDSEALQRLIRAGKSFHFETVESDSSQ